METGRVLRIFRAKNGREVILRIPRFEDLDDFLLFINSLVEEKAQILMTDKFSKEEESEWLNRALTRLERDETLYVVAEVEGNVVGNSELDRGEWSSKHVGRIGIAIKNGYRDAGIGTKMMVTLIEQAKTWGLKVLTLTAFASNLRAQQVYEKVGFVQTGLIPKKFYRGNAYVDEIIMTKLLE